MTYYVINGEDGMSWLVYIAQKFNVSFCRKSQNLSLHGLLSSKSHESGVRTQKENDILTHQKRSYIDNSQYYCQILYPYTAEGDVLG